MLRETAELSFQEAAELSFREAAELRSLRASVPQGVKITDAESKRKVKEMLAAEEAMKVRGEVACAEKHMNREREWGWKGDTLVRPPIQERLFSCAAR